MAQAVKCVVKPLVGDKSADGAFRLHLTPDTLVTAGLQIGEPCEIRSENGTTLGYGLAWRAKEGMGGSNPAVKPVRLTQAFRDLMNLSEGTQISVRRTDAKLSPAIKIIVHDVTPADSAGASETERGIWRIRTLYSLATLEAFVKGFEFDVGTTKRRKRYRVVDVQSQAGDLNVHYCNDDTELVIADATTYHPETTETAPRTGKLLDPAHFGGVLEQLNELNEAMETVLYHHQDYENRKPAGQLNEGIMIDGCEGTGKSYIIEQIRQLTAFKRTLNINPPSRSLGTGRYHEAIRNTFREAENNQPSLVLIDDCNLIAPASDRDNADVLATELDRLAHQRVLVIATCRDITDVNQSLLKPGRIPVRIELPTPDSVARASILRILLPDDDRYQDLVEEIAAKTHGFTGQDITMLVRQADRYQRKRCATESRGTAPVSDGTNGNTIIVEGPDKPVNQEQNAEVSGVAPYTIEDFENALTKVRPTALREVIFERPKIGWKDIGGSGAVQDHFDEALGWPLYHSAILAQHHLQPQKGILLYGPPGCSKTLTAQAVASHYQQNFITVKGAELTSMYVGESERAIREIFRKARQAAPCVIFFDEFDAIASSRESGEFKGLNIVTTLLTEMDGFVPLKGVTVLAATNKPEILDPAIMRPGRFATHIYIGPPNDAARKEIFGIKLAEQPIEASVDIEELVKDTEGYSGAEIVEICNLAITAVVRRKIAGSTQPLCMKDMKKALSQTKKSITHAMLESYDAFAAR